MFDYVAAVDQEAGQEAAEVGVVLLLLQLAEAGEELREGVPLY